MHVLVQFVRIRNTRHVEGFRSGDQTPKGNWISLSDDIFGETITTSMPSSWDLTSDFATEREGFRNKHACTFLELEDPLATFASPDITLVAVLKLEFGCLFGSDFNWFKIMNQVYLLVEDLLLGVVTTEKFRFYGGV